MSKLKIFIKKMCRKHRTLTVCWKGISFWGPEKQPNFINQEEIQAFPLRRTHVSLWTARGEEWGLVVNSRDVKRKRKEAGIRHTTTTSWLYYNLPNFILLTYSPWANKTTEISTSEEL
jgi:hypothetical protein